MPRAVARSLRSPCGAWFVAHTTSPPLVGSGAASVARPSSGTPQSRWLTMRCFTHALGLGEDAVRVAGLDGVLVLDVAGRVIVDARRALGHRRERIADGRQRLPVDDDVVGGVDGDSLRVWR